MYRGSLTAVRENKNHREKAWKQGNHIAWLSEDAEAICISEFSISVAKYIKLILTSFSQF